MPPALTFFSRTRLAALAGERHCLGIWVLVLLHLAALAVLMRTEGDFVPGLAFLLTWGLLNFVWLILLRRPAVAASLSLVMVVALILLSQFKQDILIMSANFVDVMLIDADTISFVLTVFPHLGWTVAVVTVVVVPLLVAALGAFGCLVALTGLSLAEPMNREKAFEATEYVSQFARSGALAFFDLATRGFLESDDTAHERLASAEPAACKPEQRLPHIVLVLDESSYDMTAVPGVKLPP